MSMKVNCFKFICLCVVITIILSSCRETNKNNTIVAYKEISIQEYMIVEKRFFWFYDNSMDKNYLSDMKVELQFSSESDAKNCFNMIVDDYENYPQFDFILEGKKITYFPFMQSHWINSYKRADVLKTLEDNGYTIIIS